ncbi:MAG: type II toxin-antitoxin system PemK/MazF family toxin [Bryobacteraceae bacterium]|nr:type II toxin-antitoxin system PemK/MazF family toxin [Bryobacteraceae bacterium]
MRYGELWWAQLDPVVGHEQAGRRPVVVVSGDWWNEIQAPVVGIVPLTSRAKGLPQHIKVPAGSGGLAVDSFLMPEHLRYVDRRRLVALVGGSLDAALLERLRTLIIRMLG